MRSASDTVSSVSCAGYAAGSNFSATIGAVVHSCRRCAITWLNAGKLYEEIQNYHLPKPSIDKGVDMVIISMNTAITTDQQAAN